ncbi:TetR/AcrR family transcriptional regulator [Dysgonomonas macrotermitis]|uniref:Transcriptional regulator, TetR family n=1 Tax=Dysgonomonas macrotermitis TaxID=1346286 RepID=A0A1M5CI69_9BACT|nr:TetR/AcrR family transcriptional regulator [Dysgonomonas macrotermitis]SHF54453.1 transcriptional regulator, TetR family [Dysgonomonas macrotermitis]
MNPSRKKILDKAFSLFLNENFDSVTMQQIQEASGISRGAIYHHFKSKEDIFKEIVDTYLLPIFSSYTGIPEDQKRTLLDTIYASIKCRQSHQNLLKEVVPFKMSDFYLYKFIFQATELYPEFNKQVNSLTEKEYNGWRNVIQIAMRTGEIRSDVDLDYVAQSLITIPLGLGVFSAFSNYININTKDIRTSYLKFYNLLKKNSFL